MISYSPLLCLDFYKTAHAEQYPATLTKMVSYYTPRMTRLADTEKVTMFGLQAFIQEYLIEAFNTHFFDRSLDEVLAEYKRVLNNTIGTDGVGVERLTALHKLGYLPLEIRAVPEGTVPIFMFRKLRSRIPTPTLCGWSTLSKQCCHVPCGILRFQRKLDIVTGRSSISTLPLPVTMMWYGPSCWATFPCVVRKAWRAPPRVLLRSA